MYGLIRNILAAAAVLLVTETAARACTGDCGGDGAVTVDEVVTGVTIALGQAPVGQCSAMDADANGQVTVDELIGAINAALSGCAPAGTPTTTPTATATATRRMADPTPTPCANSDGTAELRAVSSVPANGTGPIQASCVRVENAGGTRTELTRVTVSGTVRGIGMEVLVYFVTDTGEIDTVTYKWNPSQSFPGNFESFAFCNGAACTGASMALGSLTINLNNVPLDPGTGESALLTGTLRLNRLPNAEPTPTPAGCPGGNLTLNFRDVSNVNASPALPAQMILGAATNFSSEQPPPAFARFSAEYDGCPSMFPRQTISFSFSGAPIAAGSTYSVGIGEFLNQIEFNEMGFSSSKAWEATTGTVTIDSVDAASIQFRIEGARFRPKDLAARGNFTIDASGTLAK